jgi:maltose/moltooligosaccharide transporter
MHDDTTGAPQPPAARSGPGSATAPDDPSAQLALPGIAADGAGPPPRTLRRSLLYSSGNFGAGLYYGLNSFILPILLINLRVEPVLNNLLSSTRSFEGTVVQPIVGAWSDRTWKGFLGRRRYFIVVFAPLSALFVALTPLAARLGGLGAAFGMSSHAFTILAVALTIFLFTLIFNVMYDPYNALMADITPGEQRGRVNGVFQAVSAAGQVLVLALTIGLGLAGDNGLLNAVTPTCLVVAVVMIVSFLPTVLGIREPRHLATERAQHYTLRDYWRALWADRQVQLYFLNQFLLWFGISAIQFNLIYYAQLELHLTDIRQLILPVVLLLTTSIPVWPLGVLGDRLGLKRIYLFGVICMAGGALLGTAIHDFILMLIILGVAGVGNAAQTASSYPLLTRLVFSDEVGLYTGLNTAITSIGGPLAAIISGFVVGTLEDPHFERLFPLVAALFLASLIPLAFIRLDRSRVARAATGSYAPSASS